MGDIKQYIVFVKGGLNQDDDYSVMPEGDAPYRLHVMTGEDGKGGIFTNMKGNKMIVYEEPLTLSNTYFTLGSYYNSLTRKAYYMVFSQPYDTGGGVYKYDNRVLCLNEDSERIDTIFKDEYNYLGLDPKHLLTDMKMIETWLFYNPISSEPRMIDVEMAYNYTNYPAYNTTVVAITGDTYTYKGGLFRAKQSVSVEETPVTHPAKWDRIGNCYMNESTVEGSDFYKAFLAIKTPPISRITTYYGSDSTASFNNVAGKMFRFAHRYQYFDNSYSVFSSFSDVTKPLDTELHNGERPDSGIVNNYITLSFSLFSPALIKNIELYFQEIGGDWKRMAVINRQDQTLLDTIGYSYKFYNNESYSTLASGLADIIQDAVPNRAKAQEIINKNVLCYAGCTEGFNNIPKDEIDVTLTPVIKSIPIGSSIAVEGLVKRDLLASDIEQLDPIIDDSYPDGGHMIYTTYIDINTWFPSGVTANDIFKIAINGMTDYVVLSENDVDTALHLAYAITDIILGFGIDSTIYTNVGEGIVKVRINDYYNYVDISYAKVYNASSTITSLVKHIGFKTAAYHPFCLFYYDGALRRNTSQLVPAVYVPSVNECTPAVTGTNNKWNINWEISHRPPSWAKYWRWGKAANRRCSYFVQYIVSKIEDGSALTEPKIPVNNTVAIDVTPLQTIRTTKTSGWNCYPNSIIPLIDDTLKYRVRFMTKATTPATPGTLLGDVVDGVHDYEVIKIDSENNIIYVKKFDFATPSFGVNTLIELYVPLTTPEVETYYEFGELMPIAIDINGNLVHGGQTQNQYIDGAYVEPAKGTFFQGDVYHIMRTPSKPLCENTGETNNGVFHESMWWSDFYESDDWDKGKIGIESPIGEQTLNIIRYSNPYLQNTQVNGITTFQISHNDNGKTIFHHIELNDIYGDVTSVREVGNTLKVYQVNKTSSINIGRTEFMDAEGNFTTVGSDRVLGGIRYSEKNYGTTFPESIVKNNRYVYGFDAYQGVFWRDTPNGIKNISGRYEELGGVRDYKMSSYFRAKAKSLLKSGVEHCNVFSVWDEKHDLLYVTFKDIVNKENDETIVFSEKEDRWITFAEFFYTPENGFNEILELSYDVVKGFENGLGYSFDEATRFAVFNIGGGLGTSANINLDIDALGISMSLPDPVVTINSAPLPPTGLTISGTGGNGFTASWDASTGATGYKIDVSTGSKFESFVGVYNDFNVAGTSQIITGLSEGTIYYFRVRAYNEYGTSDNSLVSSTRTTAAPLAPMVTSGTEITTTSFRANWNASANAYGYRVDVATDDAFTSILASYNNIDAGTATSLLITGLTPNTYYRYRVRAYNLYGQTSANSEIGYVSTSINTPTSSGATSITTTSFVANWGAISGISEYYLDVATDSGFVNKVSGYDNKRIVSSTSSLVNGLMVYTTYYYRVKAYNGMSYSGYSNTIGVTTLDPATAPTALSATGITTSSFTTNWSAVSGATGYYLDVATDLYFTNFVSGFNNRNVYTATSFYIGGLAANTLYFFRVRAVKSGTTSANSDTCSVTTAQVALPAPPNAPIAYDGINNTTMSFTASWSAPTGATGYYLDVATNSSFTVYLEGYQNRNVGNINNITVMAEEHAYPVTYYYRVRAYNTGGVSGYSDVASGYTLAIQNI